MELHLKYRPKTLKTVVGQPEAVKVLGAMFAKRKIDHAIMIVGPSGCGKTTLSRQVKEQLQCSKFDYKEINCSDDNGIEAIRRLIHRVSIRPIQGKAKLYYLDEVHRMTAEAQDAFLKTLEEPPAFAYFILSTTDPKKIKETIRQRCTQVVLRPVKTSELQKLVNRVAEKEGLVLSEELVEKIVERADGSPRRALKLISTVANIEGDEERLSAVQNTYDEAKEVIELCRALANPRARWVDVSKIIKRTEQADPEEIRRVVLGYFRNILLSGGKLVSRAAQVLDYFQDAWQPNCGKAGVTLACYRSIQSD